MSADLPAVPPDAIDALIARCVAGDEAAWETIVHQQWRRVFNIAYKFVGKHDEAEDLAQDIFLRVFKSLGTFDRRANFQTWLTSVSRNLCIDHYRSVRKERETIEHGVDAEELATASTVGGPIAALEQRDRVALLRQALTSLPSSLRTAVLMRDIQELSYQTIADRLRLPQGTVKSRINRGRIELARQIKKLGGTADGLNVFPSDPRSQTGSVLMEATTDRAGSVSIVRIGEPRVMYPMLGEFSSLVETIVAGGGRSVLIDLSPVTYVDSATIGCLMDLYRQVSAVGGRLKLSGVQKRVETMLTLTGAQNFISIHADEASALKSFGD